MEQKYHFDQIIDRKNTSCLKHDFGMERKGRDDLLPLWVADMDFRLPQEVVDDLTRAVQHGIFGYTAPKDDYYQAVQGWYRAQFGWETEREWLVITPGVVFALAQAIAAYTAPGDSVLIQQPVYYPFGETIKAAGRNMVNSQLIYEDGKYRMDDADFERKIVENQVKLFVLCSPHNPVGRVWTREELEHIGTICLRHGVVVVSDEIHADFVYEGHTHHVFANLGERFRENCIVCTSPSKTFNIAGLQISNIVIPNAVLREKFLHQLDACGYSQPGALGMVAARSVYTKGKDWYRALKVYLKGNLDFAIAFLGEKLPEIRVVKPEGTYLLWLDCSGLGLHYKQLERLVVEEAKLWLDGGIIFGRETALFERINYACPRSVLETALRQLEQAVIKLRQAKSETENF